MPTNNTFRIKNGVSATSATFTELAVGLTNIDNNGLRLGNSIKFTEAGYGNNNQIIGSPASEGAVDITNSGSGIVSINYSYNGLGYADTYGHYVTADGSGVEIGIYSDVHGTNTWRWNPEGTVSTPFGELQTAAGTEGQVLSLNGSNQIVWGDSADIANFGFTTDTITSDGNIELVSNTDGDIYLTLSGTGRFYIRSDNVEKLSVTSTSTKFYGVTKLEVLSAEPSDVETGSIAMADGVNWDPATYSTTTAYLTYYNGSNWVAM